MNKNLYEHIFDLKLNEVKMQINLKADEKAYFTQELNKIYKQLSQLELNQVKQLTANRLLITSKLLIQYKNINKKTRQSHHATTEFDAKNFYELSAKKLACEYLIQDCNNLICKEEHSL